MAWGEVPYGHSVKVEQKGMQLVWAALNLSDWKLTGYNEFLLQISR